MPGALLNVVGARAAAVGVVGVMVAGLAGCGSDDGNGGDGAIDAATDARPDAPVDAALDAPTGPLTITSPVLPEGAVFPVDHTCNGVNESPPLEWVNTPPGTRSLALLMTDSTTGLIHWAIYDIPAARTGLPGAVDKRYAPPDVPGAHQARSYNAEVTGYLGPCPPAMHTYRFVLYALDVELLPGASAATTRAQVQTLVLEHDLAEAMLTGSYTQPAP